MADSMNFGPEWLRNLSSEGASSGPKYQLADFRYGREEMLALFDKNAKPPENLTRFHELLVEKTQSPMSLLPMTEDENKLWHRGINSELGLRGKAPPPGLPGAALRGRGGSVDRGRGRGRGGSFFYPRPGYDDSELQGKDQPAPFLRSSRSFDRNQIGERGWPERNGGDHADWNGSTSPRKEYGGPTGPLGNVVRGGASGSDNNWRRHRGGGAAGPEDDDAAWRQREKWQRTSWREEGTDPPEGAKPVQGGPAVQGGRSSNWGRGWVDEGIRGRDQDYDGRRHDEVPEWAHADHHEPSGSFDATGAFHGGSDEEDVGMKPQGAENGGTTRPVESQGIPEPAKELPPQPNVSASSVALSDAQSLDRIRAQHQNFVTKAEPKEAPVVGDKFEDSRAPPTARVLPMAATVPSAVAAAARDNVEKVQQGSEDMSRLNVDAVVKLIEDDIRSPSARDIWYYRDPSGNEQGPFQSAEMLSWFLAGFFDQSLLVRREHETRYLPLGQLMLPDNRPPFFNAPPPPPSPVVENFPFHLLGSMQRTLPDGEFWHNLTQAERDAVVRQKLAMSQAAPIDPITRILKHLQQTPHSALDPAMVDPVRALLMMGPQAPPAHQLPHPALQHPIPHQLQNMNSVLPGVGPVDNQQEGHLQRVLMRKLQVGKAQQRPIVDSLWSGPGRPAWTNDLSNVPTGVPIAVPSRVPLWEMKTEEDILVEQQNQMHQQRLAEEERKKEEEERRLREEEERSDRERKETERLEEDRRRMEEDTLRALLRLPKRGSPFELQPQISGLEAVEPPHQKIHREREKEEEEARKRVLEQRRKLDEMKRLEEAQKKKDEKERKKEEEKERKRLAEEEKKRQEEEKKRVKKEIEEAKRQEEAALQQQEQQRRQEEALRCLREQQMKTRVKPWSQSTLPSSSLADIQAQEKERKLQQQRDQSLLLQLVAAAELHNDTQEEKNKSAAGFNLKWASAPTPRGDHVKSLAEIQVEEQIQLAKQLEKDRLERQQQQRDLPVNSGIWGGPTGLTWVNNSSGNGGGPWGGVAPVTTSSAGFWDDVVTPTKAKAKTPVSPAKVKPQSANGPKKTTVVNNTKPAKPKAKREEAAVMKLFEPQGDEFSTWCSETLHALHAGIDVPTFSAFLREIESPYEVKDYVKTYLGETREASEFARNFLERRSRWRSACRDTQDEDDMCAPAVAVNPAHANLDSQDAAKKGKKAKKGKMIKVDTRILGFNVTAAQNRINVGERETWDPNS